MSAEVRFFDAIVRAVAARSEDWSRRIVDAAVDALVGGLDSPSLRMLAGQPITEEAMTERMLVAACEELGIPYPPRGERWVPQLIDGRRWERIASDSVRFAIEASEESVSSTELRILINGVAVSDNLLWGLGPTEIEYFIVNDQGENPRLQSCPACTEPDCDWVFVHRSHDGRTVHWEWACDVPWGMDAGASFPAEEYEEAIAEALAVRELSLDGPPIDWRLMRRRAVFLLGGSLVVSGVFAVVTIAHLWSGQVGPYAFPQVLAMTLFFGMLSIPVVVLILAFFNARATLTWPRALAGVAVSNAALMPFGYGIVAPVSFDYARGALWLGALVVGSLLVHPLALVVEQATAERRRA